MNDINNRKNFNPEKRGKDIENIKLGISHGDINGIGYEVMLKCFSDNRMFDFCTPILYGSSKIASYHKKLINATDFPFVNIRSVEQAEPNKFNILNIIQEEVKIDIGQPTEIGGKLAAMSLDIACRDLMNGKIDALVTNPINKKNIQSDKFNFPGHTEYLTKMFGVDESLMIMTCNKLHIGTSAQKLQEIYPELVSENEEGKMAVSYDRLAVIALSAVDKLYEENKQLKERLIKIEKILGIK